MKYLTFVDSINTFNLKNHQVLKLKFLSTKQWQWIYSRGGPAGPPPGSDRVKGLQSNRPSNFENDSTLVRVELGLTGSSGAGARQQTFS